MANAEETTDLIPTVAVVVQVGIPLGTIPVEVTDLPIAVELGRRTYGK